MVANDPRSTVKSVETTLSVIQQLHHGGTVTLNEIADKIGKSRSTVHRHLLTLKKEGYVIANGGEYSLSLQFLTHGGLVRDRMFASDIIDDKVRQISDRTGERAQFMVEENGERVYVYTYSGPQGVKTDTAIGKRGPLHVSAAGKSILANLPENRVERILTDINFSDATNQTIENREKLENELASVREQGYSFNDEGSTEGLRAVGVPVKHPDGSVFGAISVSGPAHRFTDEYFREELPNLLLGAANELELNLKYA